MIQWLKAGCVAVFLFAVCLPESAAQIQSRGYPQGVGPGNLSDTVLNTRAILQAAGVKKNYRYKRPTRRSENKLCRYNFSRQHWCYSKFNFLSAENTDNRIRFMHNSSFRVSPYWPGGKSNLF